MQDIKLKIGNTDYSFDVLVEKADTSNTPVLIVNGTYYRGIAIPNEQVRDYEILSFISDLGHICSLKEDGKYYYSNHGGWTLDTLLSKNAIGMSMHSVRRLSDMTDWSCKEVTNEGIIGCMYINNGSLYVGMDGLKGVYNLNDISKVVERPILFTTEDGVDIRDSDDIVLFHLSPNFDLSWSGSRFLAKQNRSYFKIFSTKKAAELYCTENKPIPISFKEIKEVIRTINDGARGTDSKSYLIGEFNKLIQSKL